MVRRLGFRDNIKKYFLLAPGVTRRKALFISVKFTSNFQASKRSNETQRGDLPTCELNFVLYNKPPDLNDLQKKDILERELNYPLAHLSSIF